MKTPLILPNEVLEFMSSFEKNGFEVYVVGGGVRDLILGKEITNWDFTTNASVEAIQKLFPEHFYENNYGTVTVVLDKEKGFLFEVTPFRKESGYTDSRHPDEIEWATKVEEDLARRDFTVNAIAFDGKSLVDPYAGEQDIEKKIIKAVGNADVRFSEDALRLMRAVRIATQLGFSIDTETLESIKKNAELITHISGERIRDELFKIIGSTRAADGITLLHETTLLKYILPEVEDCFGVDQVSPGRHHTVDVGTHLIEALRLCPSTDTITRFATLLHDIGKAKTYAKDEHTQMITFYNHEIVGASQVYEIAQRLHLSKKEREKLVTLVRYHMFTVSETQTDSAIRRFIRNVGKEYMYDALDLRVADRLGSGAKLTSWRTELFKKRLEEVQHEPFAVKDLIINGKDVMEQLSLKPSPQVGQILDALFAEVFAGTLKNEREVLLQRLTATKTDI
ncbi:MAG: HD domain-containing protein [Microgenomates group bacterium]